MGWEFYINIFRNINNIYVMSVWDDKDKLIKVLLDDNIEGKGIVGIKLVGEIFIWLFYKIMFKINIKRHISNNWLY